MVLLEVSDHASVPKRLFVVAVTAIAIMPRMPFDERFSIGGNLSNGFRKVVLTVCILNLGRNLAGPLMDKTTNKFGMVIEAILASFLNLLVPYLLRKWMSERINFPGGRRSAYGLMPWIYAITGLSLMGALPVFMMEGLNLWIFKKIADVISFFPVYRTLKVYNSITTIGGRYPGRGSVLSQVVLVSEFYALIAHSTDVLVKALYFVDMIESEKSKLLKGLYLDNHFALYTRILCHSVLLNVLDETYHCHTENSGSGSGSGHQEYSEQQSSVDSRDVYDANADGGGGGDDESGLVRLTSKKTDSSSLMVELVKV